MSIGTGKDEQASNPSVDASDPLAGDGLFMNASCNPNVRFGVQHILHSYRRPKQQDREEVSNNDPVTSVCDGVGHCVLGMIALQ